MNIDKNGLTYDDSNIIDIRIEASIPREQEIFFTDPKFGYILYLNRFKLISVHIHSQIVYMCILIYIIYTEDGQ